MEIRDCSSEEEEELECRFPTQNRFEGHIEPSRGSGRGSEWQKTRRAKRKKVSSGSMDTSTFNNQANSDKLCSLFEAVQRNYDILNDVKHEQNKYFKATQDLQIGVIKLQERAEKAERIVEQQAKCLRMLAYRSVDTEARSRRNNVIIWGVTERTKTSTESLALNFLEDELEIDTNDMVIERAHRLGSDRHQANRQDTKRPIIVRFRDYRDTERVMKSAYKLKGSPFGIDRDYPKEIASARKELYKSEEARLARQNRRKIQIKYPARLFIDGNLVRDEFPEWYSVLSSNRIAATEFGEKGDISSKNKRSVMTMPEMNAENYKTSNTNTDSENSEGEDSVFSLPKRTREEVITEAEVHAHSLTDVNKPRDTSRDNTSVPMAINSIKTNLPSSAPPVKSSTNTNTRRSRRKKSMNKSSAQNSEMKDSETHMGSTQLDPSDNTRPKNRHRENQTRVGSAAPNTDNSTHL